MEIPRSISVFSGMLGSRTMNVRRVAAVSLTVFWIGFLPPLPLTAAEPAGVDIPLATDGVDAFSALLQGNGFRYTYRVHGAWSGWHEYENDGDVSMGQESELVMLPEGVDGLRVDGIADVRDVHPIVVSHEPVKQRVAALTGKAGGGVVSRTDWGADSQYLYPGSTDRSDTSTDTDAAKSDNGAGNASTDSRVKECAQAQQDHPEEFRYASVQEKDAQGRRYLWPLQYSKNVRLLTVHHSALTVGGDPRPAVERVRAIYKYHALTKGWGDIGYHYIIDENGQVYEGRQGGDYVVGGHAYCNNIGTVGIVLLGNFEMEQPSQAQAKSLQSLLLDLAQKYKINVASGVEFHGKKFASPIVRHRDLLSTLCPGYYLSEAFSQIVEHVRSRTPDAAVTFPALPTEHRDVPRTPPPVGIQEGISFIGRTSVSINPGGRQRLSFAYTAGAGGAYEGKRVADVRISDPSLILSVDDGFHWIPVTKGILLQSDLPAYETASLQLVVQAPMQPGEYGMDIGGIHFSVSVYGRRARTGDYQSPFTAQTMQIVKPQVVQRSTAVVSRIRPQSRASMSSSSASATVTSFDPPVIAGGGMIRVRLSADASPTIRASDQMLVDGTRLPAGTSLSLVLKNGQCQALRSGNAVASGTPLRITAAASNIFTVDSVRSAVRSYHGTIECRVVNGVLTLINELPLEQYMAGLSEEPDSEPYEKQRAFAIAARTYAAYYMQSTLRKFPGMPYDGSDDPAVFQSYTGVTFEGANPRWVEAVSSTANEVLRYQNSLFKPAYFSSDDGRTRSPAEIGWKNFPAAEIFSSKQDPWCSGMALRGHGVGMSGCGAKGQAYEGRSAEQILQYYYPGSRITDL